MFSLCFTSYSNLVLLHDLDDCSCGTNLSRLKGDSYISILSNCFSKNVIRHHPYSREKTCVKNTILDYYRTSRHHKKSGTDFRKPKKKLSLSIKKAVVMTRKKQSDKKYNFVMLSF